MTSFTLLLCPSRGYYFFFLLDFRGSRVKYYWHIISEPDTAGTRGKQKYTQQLSGVCIGKADASYILNDIYESTHNILRRDHNTSYRIRFLTPVHEHPGRGVEIALPSPLE